MHENVLQTIGNREPLSRPQQEQHHYGNNFYLEEMYPRKNSAVVQPMLIQPQAFTPEKENQLKKQSCVSPVLPGTGSITHNITRMLSESTPSGKQQSSELFRSVFPTYDLPGYFNKGQDSTGNNSAYNTSKTNSEEDSIIDVESDNQEHLRTGDLPNTTDSSISTQDSSSPQSSGAVTSPASSNNSSPGSGSERVTSPDVTESEPPKKKARTNYTPDQIQTLLKIFHENPYPDSEMMEQIGKDLGVPENKIKIWFQNKRARWRRRVNDNMNTVPQPHFFPMSPMLSPVTPYGLMPPNPMMRTSPPNAFPGYFNMPWMQGPGSPNGNQAFVNNNMSRYQPTTQHSQMPQQQFSPPGFPVSTTSPYPMRTSPPQMMTSQNGRQLQYPPFLYPSSYPTSQTLQ